MSRECWGSGHAMIDTLRNELCLDYVESTKRKGAEGPQDLGELQ